MPPKQESDFKICQLGNGLATTIESALIAYLEEKDTNMVGFAIDGAQVMIGRNNGVGARLKRRQPKSYLCPLYVSLSYFGSSSWKRCCI